MPLVNSASALVSYIKGVKDAKGPINTPHGTLYPLLSADIDRLMVELENDLEPSAAQVAKDAEKSRKDAADKAAKDAKDLDKLKEDIRKQMKDELHREALLKEEADQMATITQLRAELAPQVATEVSAEHVELTQAEKDKVAKDLKAKEEENAKPDAKTPSAKPAPVTPPGPSKAVPTKAPDSKPAPAPSSQQPKK